MSDLRYRDKYAIVRLALALISAYGVWTAAQATGNQRQIAAQAKHGDPTAQSHFTRTRYAAVFGVRNSDLGLVFYTLTLLAAVSGIISRRSILAGLTLASWTSLLTSAYLLQALAFRLRVWCPICMKAHAVNAAIFTCLLVIRKDRPASAG